jgi:hypothetical protein
LPSGRQQARFGCPPRADLFVADPDPPEEDRPVAEERDRFIRSDAVICRTGDRTPIDAVAGNEESRPGRESDCEIAAARRDDALNMG